MTTTYPDRLRLTQHFWLHEALASAVAARDAIDNTPPLHMLPVLCNTAAHLEDVRAYLGGRPIVASSWYRSPELNKAVRGAGTSQHMQGEAVDFNVVGMSTVEAARMLASPRCGIDFDQLVLEYPNSTAPWIHISFAFCRAPRREVLHIESRATSYQPGLGRWGR